MSPKENKPYYPCLLAFLLFLEHLVLSRNSSTSPRFLCIQAFGGKITLSLFLTLFVLPQNESPLWTLTQSFSFFTAHSLKVQVPHLKIFFSLFCSYLSSSFRECCSCECSGQKRAAEVLQEESLFQKSQHSCARLAKAAFIGIAFRVIRGHDGSSKAVVHLPLEYYLFVLLPSKSHSQPSLNMRDLTSRFFFAQQIWAVGEKQAALSMGAGSLCKAVKGWPGCQCICLPTWEGLGVRGNAMYNQGMREHGGLFLGIEC